MPDKQRLTEINTEWTLLRIAHTPTELGTPLAAEAAEAMRRLISRYHDAVGRYLRLKLRDQNLADEISQEFWTKLLTHKLAAADPSKGRFRDYLRTVLHRLIIDHFRSRKLQQLPPGDLLDPTTTDEDFDQVWREAVINRVWSRLETYEVSTPNNRYATVLHLRRDRPDTPIEHLAAVLSEQTGTPVRPEAFRKTLQRARSKFFELLIQELRETIHPAEPEDIETEIYDLGLGALYKKHQSETNAT